MRKFLAVLGRSPFGPVQAHMNKVQETIEQLRPFFEAFLAGDVEKCTAIRKAIYKLEHEADRLKNDIRDHLPKSYFMLVDRRDLLALLHQQDKLADLCEDMAIVASLREDLALPDDLRQSVLNLVELAVATCATAHRIIDRLDELVEASFGGPEAEQVMAMIDEVGRQEHEVDKAAFSIARELFRREAEIGVLPLMLWQKILELLGDLANASETIGDQLRLMLSK